MRPTITNIQVRESVDILNKYGVQADEKTYALIMDLHMHLRGVVMFFKIFGDEREAINRDNKRLLKIKKLVDQLETNGFKQQFLSQLPILQLYPDKKMTIPNSNEILQHVVTRCGVFAEHLDAGKFQVLKKDMYQMIAQVVNVLDPDSRFFREPDVHLHEAELKAFQKYLFPKGDTTSLF